MRRSELLNEPKPSPDRKPFCWYCALPPWPYLRYFLLLNENMPMDAAFRRSPRAPARGENRCKTLEPR